MPPPASTIAAYWPAWSSPAMARLATSAGLRAPPAAAGTASRIASSPPGRPISLATNAIARLVIPLASLTVMARSLPMCG